MVTSYASNRIGPRLHGRLILESNLLGTQREKKVVFECSLRVCSLCIYEISLPSILSSTFAPFLLSTSAVQADSDSYKVRLSIQSLIDSFNIKISCHQIQSSQKCYQFRPIHFLYVEKIRRNPFPVSVFRTEPELFTTKTTRQTKTQNFESANFFASNSK